MFAKWSMSASNLYDKFILREKYRELICTSNFIWEKNTAQEGERRSWMQPLRDRGGGQGLPHACPRDEIEWSGNPIIQDAHVWRARDAQDRTGISQLRGSPAAKQESPPFHCWCRSLSNFFAIVDQLRVPSPFHPSNRVRFQPYRKLTLISFSFSYPSN